MGLPHANILAAIPNIVDDLGPNEHDAALFLLEEYADLFSTGTHDFGLIKGTQNQLNLEDICLF